ncbi:MAG: hypothetical protein KAV40_03495, partial [Thermoplasmatales archaeon]|nr:hypothetical protein [Thermoplasmatales archaeon]
RFGGGKMAVKCKKCIHSYYGHIKREGMGGYTEYIPALKCDLGYEIQMGGVPKNPDCFEQK